MKLTDKIRQRQNVVSASMNDSLVMMDIESGKYYNLVGVGGDIWKLIENEMTVEEILSALMKEYDVPQDKCEQQTVAFLEELSACGLISVENA